MYVNPRADEAPEALLAFFDQGSGSSTRTPGPSVEAEQGLGPPRKRRKVVKGEVAEHSSTSASSREYLSIARVDLTLVQVMLSRS